MKINLLSCLRRDENETIATFGGARLVKNPKGRFSLIGGSEANRADAREWCSLFLHEAILDPDPASAASTAVPGASVTARDWECWLPRRTRRNAAVCRAW
jgi:hypothetical protein